MTCSPSSGGGAGLLVRARHNRNLQVVSAEEGTPQRFDWRRGQPGQARLEIDVARVSKRVHTCHQPESALREARTAQVTLRWRELSLPATEDSASCSEPPVELWAVHVAEEAAPPGVERWGPVYFIAFVPDSLNTESDEVSGQSGMIHTRSGRDKALCQCGLRGSPPKSSFLQ